MTLAADKSMRRMDADGHMHVEMANISKANVCPYFGREIPDYEALGLDANRVYMLYRDPVELARAAESFAGKPLLMHHKPVTADDHPEELVVGAIGTDVSFDGTFLKAPLSVWTEPAIKAIKTRKQRELSPGYRYTADMSPGLSPEGVAFHGRMRNIMGNHLAIVIEGRTGPDVVVPDESPTEFSTMRFPKFMAAFAAMFPTVKPEQVVALDAALGSELLAADEFDLSEDERVAACDAYSKAMGKACDALTDEDKAEAYKRAAKDKKSKASGNPVPFGGMDEAAFTVKAREGYVLATDATTAQNAAVAAATAELVTKADAAKLATDAASAATQAAHELFAARAAVADKVGAVGLDSADAVYRFALDQLKVAHKDVPAAALSALYEGIKAPAAPVVADAKPSITDYFPGLAITRKG